MMNIETQQAVNLEDLSAIQYGWDLSVTQLGPSEQLSSVSLIQTDKVGLSRLRLNTNCDQRVHARPGFLCFGILEPDCPGTWLGSDTIPFEGVIVVPREDDASAVSCVGFHGNGMHFSEHYLAGLAETVFRKPLELLVPPAGLYVLESAQQRNLRAELRKWRQVIAQGAEARASIVARREESLAVAVLDGLASATRSDKMVSLKSDRALDIALEYIHDQPLENIAAADLCKVTECSQRSLENSFKKRFGVSPKHYIKCHRLARVRQGLLNFDEQAYRSIIDLASTQGFWHMGQFAADYRKLFGELPSETAARYRT